MKKLLLLLLAACNFAIAQTVTRPTFSDDSYVAVPLQFGFPFYGRVFTNSWMHSNGVVSFLDPAVPVPNAGYNPGQWAYCCEGVQPTTTRPEFSYMIAPLWTDLYPTPNSTFRTEGTATYQKYYWNNIAEISNGNNLNTFSLEIRPTGFIGANYTQINIQNQNTWIGTIGDPTRSQWNQIHYGTGVPSTLPSWSMPNTPGDICASNPLSSSTCPGYTDAMCAANPLYSSSCSGYQQAYLTQQCSSNPLYNSLCPGYASAYLAYQCSNDPLYSTTCPGYEQAYFNQQCTANPLYNSRCPGYDQAYFAQQCDANGLYSTACPNYATAYAKKMLLEQQGIASTVATAGVVAKTAEVANANISSTSTSDGSSSVAVAVVADPVVNAAVTSTATSTSPAAAATATVSLAPAPAAPPPPPNPPEPKGGPAGGQPPPQQGGQGGDKPQPSARQALAERRQEAAKKEAVEKGKNLANEMGKAADMESQKQVQNVVIQAMGFTPGFDTYGKVLVPDGVGYNPFTVYNGQVNVDNRRLGMGMYGPSDRLHNDLVNSQFKD